MPTDWTRREVLTTLSMTAAAGLAVAHAGPAAAQSVKWSAGTAAPKLKAPANATDCHHHVYDAKYSVDPKATLRPPDASVDDYRALQKRIGTTRNVLVQPSTYGTDNRCHLDALAAFGPTARMVAVVDDSVSTEELKRMHAVGVRGIRFNLAQAGATTPEMMEPLSRRINGLGWHIQVNAPAAKILEIMPILERVPSPIVFDHLAHIPQPDGVSHPLYAKVRALMDKGRTWVKLSGAYADTKVGPPTYADSSAVARAYAKAAPERCVWGSDWPHPSEQAKQQLPDDAVLFDLLSARPATHSTSPPAPFIRPRATRARTSASSFWCSWSRIRRIPPPSPNRTPSRRTSERTRALGAATVVLQRFDYLRRDYR